MASTIMQRRRPQRISVFDEGYAAQAEAVVRAIRAGEVDSFVVHTAQGEKVYTLQGADSPYALTLDAMNEGAALLGRNAHMLHCNAALAALLGRPKTALLSAAFRDFVRPSDRRRFDQFLKSAASRTTQTELALLRGHESVVPVALSGSPLRIEEVPAVCVVVSDQRALRRATRAVRDWAGFSAQIIDSAREGMVVLDPELRCTVWNRYMSEITGVPASKALGSRLLRVLHTDAEARHLSAQQQALRGEVNYVESAFSVPGSGRSGCASAIYSPLRNSAGEVTGVLAVIREISDEKRMHNELRQTAERLRLLTQRLHKVREEESARISREIHDELGALLAALRMEIALVSEAVNSDAARASIRKSNLMIDKMAAIVRDIAAQLRPPELDDLGLVAAIEKELKQLQERVRIRCLLAAPRRAPALERETAIVLFRIFQECTTNVVRHAGATRLGVRISQRCNAKGGRLLLTVRDNGRGFDCDGREAAHSLGLAGMRERAASVGGELTIRSSPGRGTAVTVAVPLPPKV